MEIKDALDMMNSDFKLWESAVTEDLGDGRVAKVLDLPWGIGKYRVEMEGMSNATQRRAAVSAFGDHIREVIQDRINDEGIESRAKTAAADIEQADNTDGDDVGVVLGVHDSAVQEETNEDAEGTHQEDATRPTRFGDDLTATRAAVHGRINYLTDELANLCRQLRGIDAAIKAMEEDTDE